MTVDLRSDSSHSQLSSQKSQKDGTYSTNSVWANDRQNPYNWPLWRKWMTMVISYWVTILVGINATSFTTAAEALSADFNVSNSFFEFSFFAVTSWNATAAIVPLATLPMMDTFGFRIGYTVCIYPTLFSTSGGVLIIPGRLYLIFRLYNPTMCGAELRNAGRLPLSCRGFRRDCPECCRWHCGKSIFYSPGANFALNNICLYSNFWGYYWSCIWCLG